jgi:hypothetical protein
VPRLELQAAVHQLLPLAHGARAGTGNPHTTQHDRHQAQVPAGTAAITSAAATPSPQGGAQCPVSRAVDSQWCGAGAATTTDCSAVRSMIAIDDMRPELEPYGQAHMHTPHIQQLASRSVLFSRAYVQVAVCMPSRNALLFSRRPDTSMAWSISPTQWPRMCGGASCAGNECGPACGLREADGEKQLGVSLPMWFLQVRAITSQPRQHALTAGDLRPAAPARLLHGWGRQDFSRCAQRSTLRPYPTKNAPPN